MAQRVYLVFAIQKPTPLSVPAVAVPAQVVIADSEEAAAAAISTALPLGVKATDCQVRSIYLWELS